MTLGNDPATGKEVHVPMKDVLPMVEPDDLVLDGWDISSADLGAAMERAKVLDYDLQRQVRADLAKLRPRAAVYDADFIAANQEERADNVILGSKKEQVEKVREFRKKMSGINAEKYEVYGIG